MLALWAAYTLVMKDKPIASAASFLTGAGILAAGYYERRKTRQVANPPKNPNQ